MWARLDERSWDALRRVVQNPVVRPEHFAQAFAGILTRVAEEFEQEGLAFPDSAEELQSLLNSRMSPAA